MHNATKAFVIAGSVLLSLMVIGLALFVYQRISNLEQAQVDSEDEKKLVNYSLRFEEYNRTIYGSELLSLANLHDDYQKKQVELEGYDPVTIEVRITRRIYGTTYFYTGTRYIQSLYTEKNNFENLLERYRRENNATQYENLQSIYTEFKGKRFRCDRVTYNSRTQRINYMKFTEI